MDSVNQTLETVFQNQTFVTVLTIVLVVYSTAVAPALPDKLIQFADSLPGKLLFVFIIGFFATRNIQLAIMAAVAFVVTLSVANNNRLDEAFRNYDYVNSAIPETFAKDDSDDEDKHEEHDEDHKEKFEHDSEHHEGEHHEGEHHEGEHHEGEHDEEQEEFYNYDSVVPAYNTNADPSKNFAPF